MGRSAGRRPAGFAVYSFGLFKEKIGCDEIHKCMEEYGGPNTAAKILDLAGNGGMDELE